MNELRVVCFVIVFVSLHWNPNLRWKGTLYITESEHDLCAILKFSKPFYEKQYNDYLENYLINSKMISKF